MGIALLGGQHTNRNRNVILTTMDYGPTINVMKYVPVKNARQPHYYIHQAEYEYQKYFSRYFYS